MFLFLLFIAFNYSLCIECPRDKPILKNNECQNIYCGPEDFEKNICSVSNPFIKIQWLNHFHFFDTSGISNVCETYNSKGDLFLIAQSYFTGSGDKCLYAFSQDGRGLFYNKINKTNYPFKTINLPKYKNPEIFHNVQVKEKEYLLSPQKEGEIFLIDFNNKNFTNFKFDSYSHYSNNIFRLKGYYDEEETKNESENIYLTSSILCPTESDLDNCYLNLRIFRFNLTNMNIILENPDKIRVHHKSKLNCFQNDDLYIQCIYNTYDKNNDIEIVKHVLSLFNYKTLQIEYNKILEDNFNIDGFFDSSLQLNGNAFVVGYSYPDDRNVIKLMIKKFRIEKNNGNNNIYLEDYLPTIQNIDINKDEYYSLERSLSNRNSMIKISETKFAILLNEFTGIAKSNSFNKNILILIVNIFDNSKISIRHYKIDFSLYNLVILEDLKGYKLNNFLGIFLKSGIDMSSSKTKATFLTFGYVNSTYDEIPIDKKLKENNTNSIIVPKDYISEIENNLFGYKLIGIKILELPNRLKCGYFINNETNEEINKGEIVNINIVLRFILKRKLNLEEDFEINFAGIVEEPSYDEMNDNADRVDFYPENNTEFERKFYEPKQLIGRIINYKFEIRCYKSCSGCYKFSNDPNDQQCIQCKPNYYFQKDTNNCYKSLDGYYLDKETKNLVSCFNACKTCDGPPIDSNHMNCLTCKDNLKYYHSTNCLNCDKYINPELTKCLSYIPEGYFLANSNSGILGKCHEYCKTCKDYPTEYNTNCLECKYNNSDFKPQFEGDCPPEEIILGIEKDEVLNKQENLEGKEEEQAEDWEDGECPKYKPFLKNTLYCTNECTKEEFEQKICVISNSIIKTQWINNLQRLGEGNIMTVGLDYGFDGELFLFGQKTYGITNEIGIYGIDKNGRPYFYNENQNIYYSFKYIKFSENVYLEGIKLVKNYDNNQIFIISNQLDDRMIQINFDNTIKIHTFNDSSYNSGDIFTLKNYPKQYFTNFIFYQSSYKLSQCNLLLRRFKFESDKNEIKIIKEAVGQKKEISQENNFACVEGYNDYIQCIYTEIDDGINYHVLGFFEPETLTLEYHFNLYDYFDMNPFFDSLIKLNDEAFVIAFSTERNIIRVLINTLKFDFLMRNPTIEDYIREVSYININDDDHYIFDYGLYDRNSLCKINDNKFAILLSSFNKYETQNYENNEILIYIFSIFNNHNNISVRTYSINLKLYNIINYGKILGYNIGQFFGILVDLSPVGNKAVVNSAFMTFGYVNTTGPSSINDFSFILENSIYSKPINFKNYIQEIENNLFGYEFLGVIILDLPDESLGYFIDNNEEKISINQTLNLSSEIKLKLSRNYKSGEYSISFAGAAKEPDFDNLNKYSEKTVSYPGYNSRSEKFFYLPKTLIGKKLKYKFNITIQEGKDSECYPSCLTCFSYSKDEENHLCKICKPDFYFVEDTNNCFKDLSEHYYFDEEKKIFSHCYKDCLTCAKKEINSTYMNCLSCENDYKFYNKSKNCLKCPKFVNYMQTECIDKIPEGYFLLDERLGTIEKCHKLCKTCKKGPFNQDNRYYMNCETCLYINESFVPTLPGDCPSSGKENINDDEPVDGQCPKYKPILKDNKCQLIYCTEKEFSDKTCKILNNYIKVQWLNNFHIFDEVSTSYVSYDSNENGDLFFLAQKEDDKYIKKYIYGFNINGTGILYDKKSQDYTSFKTISFQFTNYTNSIKYIQINKEGYLLNLLKDKQIYLIDYNKDEVYEKNLPFLYDTNTPYTIDTIIKLKDRENIYFYDYVYCTDQNVFDKCYLRLINFKVNSKDNFALENSNSEKQIQVNYKTKLTCVENSKYFIQCTYTTKNDLKNNDNANDNQHILGLFNHDNLTFIQSFVLQNDFNLEATFDSMIQLKDNVCVIAYSINPNLIHVLFKKISVDLNKKYILLDYIDTIQYININEDSEYLFKGGNAFRNNLFRINGEEFIMLINEFNNNGGNSNLNSGVIILHFKIYNFERNIIVRHYKIDLSLYNMFINGDIKGYKLNNFLGALFELTSPNEKSKSRAAFLTFGYVNTTNDVNAEEGKSELIDNKKSIKINKYITGIENNLFGYEFIGVKILSIPDESKVGYFINKNNNKKIKFNDTIDLNSEINLVINENPIYGVYYISFAGVVKEPEFYLANNYSIKVENYPNNSTPEKYLNEQKTLIGKEFKYYFNISKEKKCYQNCETCIRPSNNINEQDCLSCKKGFYFKDGTKNCYDKIEYEYYFNKENNSFSPCYKDCYTCEQKELNQNHMNCKSCHNLYKFYENSTNCLKCSKYVNYLQTECIDVIPDGYFLVDNNLGTIEKCHDLCKTCKNKPIEINNQIHMNCDTCLYENKNNIELIEGNCPEAPSGEGSNNNLLFLILIIIGILVLLFGIFIIRRKCHICKQNKNNDKNNDDYENMEGKNIPLEDEKNEKIN